MSGYLSWEINWRWKFIRSMKRQINCFLTGYFFFFIIGQFSQEPSKSVNYYVLLNYTCHGVELTILLMVTMLNSGHPDAFSYTRNKLKCPVLQSSRPFKPCSRNQENLRLLLCGCSKLITADTIFHVSGSNEDSKCEFWFPIRII